MPPHNRAAGVRALYRQKKKRYLRSFFWRLGVVRRPAFFKCDSGLGLPKNSVVRKLVYIITTRPIRKKCRGTQCRRTIVRLGSEPSIDKKKKRHLRSFFGASAWYAAPHFSNALRDSDSRKIALCVNLFTLSQRVQFGRSVVAHSAAAQSCGWGQSPL